jgi:hypothetical protein
MNSPLALSKRIKTPSKVAVEFRSLELRSKKVRISFGSSGVKCM